MDSGDIGALLAIGFFMFCGGLIGFGVGSCTKGQTDQDSAVNLGHAEYYLDDKHERQFRWKEVHP